MKATLYRPVSDDLLIKINPTHDIPREGVAEYSYEAAMRGLRREKEKHGGNWHIEKLIKNPNFGCGEKWVRAH